MVFHAIIVDDEPDAIDMLQTMIEYTPYDVVIDACFTDSRKALTYDGWDEAHLLFLDVHMPFISGVELLEQLGPIRARTIFTTAHEKYAIQALKLGACDYLQKPVELAELSEALKRATQQLTPKSTQKPRMTDHVCVPTSQGFRVLELADLLYLEASGNYTYLQLKSEEKKLIVSRTLKVFEDHFANSLFARINQSVIVNLHYLQTYERGNGGIVTLINGEHFTVSSKYKRAFLQLLESIRV